MPGVSADATDAVLSGWTVASGASVSGGEVIAVIETDKAEVDLEAEEDAVLFRTLVSAGDRVPVGDPIALLVKPGEQIVDEAAVLAAFGLGPQSSGPLLPVDEERSQDALVPGAPVEIHRTRDDVAGRSDHRGGRVFASPLARRLAGEGGLSLDTLTGSGPGGRVTRSDVELALVGMAQQASSVSAAGGALPPDATLVSPQPGRGLEEPLARANVTAAFTDVPHTRIRRTIASALTASKQQVPHFYLKVTCTVEALLELRTQINVGREVKITLNDLFVKAAAGAMVAVPEMNVAWTAEATRQFESVDIAVAMATARGLITPVVRAVEKRSVSDISRTIKEFAMRANSGGLRQHEIEGGSLTVSNLGMYGAEEFVAIINPPQVGILALGAVTSLPMEYEAGRLGLAKAVRAVLSVDHRPVDGSVAAQWLDQFKRLVETPLQLLT